MVKRFIFSFFFLSLCFQLFILTVNAGDINTQKTITRNIQLDIPLLNQMDHPKLYNGCEVTSLAMILNYKGIMSKLKNTLADKIAKVPITYHNGKSGNPHFGFVGSMEDGPGLGVYHEPIFSLAKQYVW